MSLASAPELLAATAILLVAAAHRPHPVRRVPVRDQPAFRSMLGRRVRATMRLPDDPLADRVMDAAIVVAVPTALVEPMLASVVIGCALALPVLHARRRQRRYEAAVVAELPAIVDLLSLALSSTGSVQLAVRAVADSGSGPVAAALVEAVTRVDAGHRLTSALEHACAPLGPPARPLVRSLVGAERYGVPLGSALDRLGHEARRRHRRQVESAARRVPVRLLAPLALCMLPAFTLLTIVPVLARTLTNLPLR